MIGPNLIDIAKTRIEVVAPLALEILSVLAVSLGSITTIRG
jgi:hypothetical protein